MQLKLNTKSTLNAEVILLFKENLEQFIKETQCPNSKAILEKSFFKASSKEILPLLHGEKTVILAGLGSANEFMYSEYNNDINAITKSLKQLNISEISININYVSSILDDVKTVAKETVRNLISESYYFDKLKTKKETYSLNIIEVITSSGEELNKSIETANAIACGQNYAKELQDLPANICNTDYMLNEAKKLTSKYKKFNLSYLTEEQMEELGMNCALAVGRGSDMPNYTVCMEYNGGKEDDAPIVIVGKGLVFDNGGVCIKPASGMDTMKMDMGGAATTIGTMKTLAMLDLPINVVGVMGLAENAVDSRSYRPGDVLTAMNGKTVEISNTDAEGRLVLCDTLTYIGKYNPKAVINIATLTGAIIISLGDAFSGLFTNNDDLANDLQKASCESKDPIWRLPLHKPYLSKLNTDVADINNCNKDRAAGSIVAGLFLSEFTKDYKWAHIDIAGSAMGDFMKCKASGRPVPLLTQYLTNQCK